MRHFLYLIYLIKNIVDLNTEKRYEYTNDILFQYILCMNIIYSLYGFVFFYIFLGKCD